MYLIKKLLEIFFLILGVIFFLLILLGTYFYVVDPFGIKPFVRNFINQEQTSTSTPVAPSVPGNKNPLLSPQQEQVLQRAGVDPTTLPSQITPAMMECFILKLGTERADEIKKGATPTAADFFVVRSCL